MAYKAHDPSLQPQPGNVWKVAYGRGGQVSKLEGLSGPDFLAGVEERSRVAEFSQVEHLRWLERQGNCLFPFGHNGRVRFPSPWGMWPRSWPALPCTRTLPCLSWLAKATSESGKRNLWRLRAGEVRKTAPQDSCIVDSRSAQCLCVRLGGGFFRQQAGHFREVEP
jgi:hypothetical protein